jgi:hypothetical protein
MMTLKDFKFLKLLATVLPIVYNGTLENFQ